MEHQIPDGYDEKFTAFIKMCADAKGKDIDAVIIAQPWVLGDTYEEVMESLGRLASSNLGLRIAKPE